MRPPSRDPVSAYASPRDVSAADNSTAYSRKKRLAADARCRAYRRRRAAGESASEIAKAEGVSDGVIYEVLTRVLPEDRERNAPRGTSVPSLSRGQVARALGLPAYAI